MVSAMLNPTGTACSGCYADRLSNGRRGLCYEGLPCGHCLSRCNSHHPFLKECSFVEEISAGSRNTTRSRESHLAARRCDLEDLEQLPPVLSGRNQNELLETLRRTHHCS